jgi:hypothetical protein
MKRRHRPPGNAGLPRISVSVFLLCFSASLLTIAPSSAEAELRTRAKLSRPQGRLKTRLPGKRSATKRPAERKSFTVPANALAVLRWVGDQAKAAGEPVPVEYAGAKVKAMPWTARFTRNVQAVETRAAAKERARQAAEAARLAELARIEAMRRVSAD